MIWSLRDQARQTNAPPLQGRGRGWGLSAERIDGLQARAREMRNNPTEPEKRLWRRLSNGQLEGFKFRRQQVIGQHIADFVCPARKLIVELDGDTHEAVADKARDAALAQFGYRVIHIANHDVMTNVEGALRLIAEMLCQEAKPHPTPSPEGEGFTDTQGPSN